MTSIDMDWLRAPPLQRLLAILAGDGEEARIAGGAVRNMLLGEPISDVDIATTLVPEAVIERLSGEGIKTVPTGIEHGTITAIVEGIGFEVTTLRHDIETDGRHAVVRFGRDWCEDALRRDFTINALYVDRDGEVFDPLEGRADINARRVRFIGDASDRIREDYLRILRFFRFFAWYGHGAPDRDGLKACVKYRNCLNKISAERVWKELHKTLQATDPHRAILWMRQAGVLGVILPESEKWGIDALPRLLRAGGDLDWPIDPMLRLMAIVPPQNEPVKVLSERLRLSNNQRKRLQQWVKSAAPSPESSDLAFSKMLYSGEVSGIIDRMMLELARLRQQAVEDDVALGHAASMSRLLDFARNWQRPKFPVKGRDLIARGMEPGEAVGFRLRELEKRWIDSGFALKKKELLNI